MRQLAARLVLFISRYKIIGAPPKHPVCVLVAAPHTSNWDFFLMLAIAWRSGLTPVWLGKKEMFFFPVKGLLRRLGGIPVDRQSPAGMVAEIVARAKAGAHTAIVIPPEGTRSKKTYWKSGFRRIAAGAEIPIVLTFLDGPNKTGGYGVELYATDDVVADMDKIRSFYADKRGVKPGKFTPPLLREEVEEMEPAS